MQRNRNNRVGKTRDLFKKIRDTKGIFHAQMGSMKYQNDRDLTEAEDIRRGGKNTEELWTDVCNIVEEVVSKTVSKEKKCKKVKWLSEVALQMAEKKRSERQRRIYPSLCRVSKNSKER